MRIVTNREVVAHIENNEIHPRVVVQGGVYPFSAGKSFLFVFKLVDGTDFGTPETGKSPVVTISINGAPYASLTGSPAVSEIGEGKYSVTIPAVDVVSGTIALQVSASGCAKEDFIIYIN